MIQRSLPWVLAAAVAASSLNGCATISDAVDALNPFAPSGPKMSPLPEIKPTGEARSLWSQAVGASSGYVFTPAEAGAAVFAANRKGELWRFEEGKLSWKINTGQMLSAGVGADRQIVVVGTAKGDVLAFAADSGKALWQAKVSSEVLAAPTVEGNHVAVRSGDNRIFLFDAQSGARRWVYERPMPILAVRATGRPVFADRYVLAGFPGGKLVAVALENGAQVWEGAVAQPKGATELDRVADVVAPPVLEGGQLCAVAFQGRVTCFDMGQGGAIVWSRDISSARGLALDGRYLFVTDDEGVVYGLDRLSGSSLWKQDKLRYRQVSAPAVQGNTVVVADGEGYVHFLSREEGAFEARLKTDGKPIDAAPQRLSNGAVLIQTSGGDLRAVSAP
ncbi:outer membrane protein assembly factor BamB [Azonexus sp.]|uniref:outer membrane protein assembly factor BamB n=1 Tax=Azonexus sp. TaxID=1872668 RepID=UPI0039E463F7